MANFQMSDPQIFKSLSKDFNPAWRGDIMASGLKTAGIQNIEKQPGLIWPDWLLLKLC